MAQQKPRSQWSPGWVAVVTALAAAAMVRAIRADVLPLPWWGPPVLAVPCALGLAAAAVVATNAGGWARHHLARCVALLAACGWVGWASLVGWTQWVWLVLLGGTLTVGALLHACRRPDDEAPAPAVEQEPADTRPADVRAWEALLRRLTRAPVTVTAVEPWANPADGTRVRIALPVEGDITAEKLVAICPNIAVARRLPPGCTVRVLDGEGDVAHQGEVLLDVMLRDCLADPVTVEPEFGPVSVYDSFQVMTTPRGESLEVCLRSQSMVIGGAPDAGKTTLLHRIILWLARCTDALVWVVDTNGGGVATPWVRPWALGLADRPVVDWVAADEEEAAVLVAVARAIAKDRKTSPEATRRKHDANTIVLPVDADLPAIVVLNDEGGEIRQAASLLGQLADEGLSRLAEIGRAEAVRVVKSVLRGTSDLLDKALRVCAALRICLQMTESDEYGHVLGENPGKVKLLHKGSGWIRRPGDPRSILGRTVNVLLSTIEQAAVACAHLRPPLDERGRKVAAKVRVRDVLDGRQPAPEILALPVMRDVEAGLAYERRWERYAPQLAAMRGEELPDVDEPGEAQPPAPAAPTAAAGPAVSSLHGPASLALLAGVGMLPGGAAGEASAAEPAPRPRLDKADVDREAQRLLAEAFAGEQPAPAPAKMTTREHIRAILAERYPEALTSSQIGVELDKRGVKVERTYLLGLLKDMRDKGQVLRTESQAYTVDVRG